jgi:hypothetical protein
MIAGLVPGMSLSSGSAVGANAWQVPATIGPPQNFAGEVELIAELHLADATIAHRQSVHIEWIAAAAAGPDPVAIASSPADSEQVPDVDPVGGTTGTGFLIGNATAPTS